MKNGPALGNGAPASVARSLRLLLIEDSEFDAGMILRLLRQSGFDVESHRVEDSAGLREALSVRTWDAVISDHYLPDFSSTDALQVCQEARLDSPFIIVSGQIGEDVAVEAMLAGADDYVLKSNLGRLPPALRRSLQAAESRRIQRTAEHSLAESESRLRGITSNLPGLVFQLECNGDDGDWRFRYASEGALALLGLHPAELLANAQRFRARIDAHDRRHLDTALAKGAREVASVHWDGRLCASAGHPDVWIALACRPATGAGAMQRWEGVMIDITAQKMAEAALAQSREDLRALTLHQEQAREEERKSVAREVHDDIGSILTGLRFELAACREQPELSASLRPRLESMLSLVDSARVASDRIMRNLRPSILDQGIVPALEWLSRQFGNSYPIKCTFQTNQEVVALPDEGCTAMFRICQEALTNVVKHANATVVAIELFADDQSVALEISDNGTGILARDIQIGERFGIRGMRERATGLGGWVELHGSPSSGTTVMLSLPLGMAAS